MAVHPTAVVHSLASLPDDVCVGPHAFIGADVCLGSGCQVDAHAVLEGPLQAGKNNHFHGHCLVGGAPQHREHARSHAPLIMGDDNVVREFATLNRGTESGLPGAGKTQVGDRNYFMAYAHVGHDCVLGNDNTLVNHAALAGHVTVGDYVTFTGFVAVHQFVHIGSYAFLGRATKVVQALLPFVMVTGLPGRPVGLNLVGMRRAGFSRADIKAAKQAYQIVFHQGLSLEAAREALAAIPQAPTVALMRDFLRAVPRGLARPDAGREAVQVESA